MHIKWIVAMVAVFVLAFDKPALAGTFSFGTQETIHHLQDIEMTGPDGEALYLGYKTSVMNVFAGIYLHDDGYVLGIKGNDRRYFRMPEGAKLALLQRAGLLPNPLPPYTLGILDYLIGYSLSIVLAITIPLYALRDRYLARRRAAATARAPAQGDGLNRSLDRDHKADRRDGTPAEGGGPAISLPIILRVKRGKVLRYLLLSIALVIACIVAIPTRPDTAYPGIAFFGMGALVFTIQLHPKSSYLRLTKEGFTIHSLFRSQPIVAWHDVSHFFAMSIRGGTKVGWNYAPQYAALSAGRAFVKSVAGAEGMLPDTYGMKADDLVELMNAVRAQCLGDHAGERAA